MVCRKVVYKSRSLDAIFQLFVAASIQVRLLFEGGLYANPESVKPVKAVWHMKNESETWHGDCSTIVSNVNKHLACEML